MSEAHKIFGYGSLVNQKTIPNEHVKRSKRAKLLGYTRDWCCPVYVSGVRFLALGVHRAESNADIIEGLLIETDDNGLNYLEEREVGYARQAACSFDEYQNKEACTTYCLPRSQEGYIALSYLCTVVDGFRQISGERGVQRFLETTRFRERRILHDLRAPRYRRIPNSAFREERVIRRYLDNNTDSVYVYEVEMSDEWCIT